MEEEIMDTNKLKVTSLKSHNWSFEVEFGIYKAEVVFDSDFNVQTVEVGTKGGYWGGLAREGEPFFSTSEFKEYSVFIAEVQKQIELIQKEKANKDFFENSNGEVISFFLGV